MPGYARTHANIITLRMQVHAVSCVMQSRAHESSHASCALYACGRCNSQCEADVCVYMCIFAMLRKIARWEDEGKIIFLNVPISQIT